MGRVGHLNPFAENVFDSLSTQGGDQQSTPKTTRVHFWSVGSSEGYQGASHGLLLTLGSPLPVCTGVQGRTPGGRGAEEHGPAAGGSVPNSLPPGGRCG